MSQSKLINKKENLPPIDSSLFTFRPKLNPKSLMIAENLLDFYERQNIYNKNKLELLEEAYRMSTNDYGKLLLSGSNNNTTEPTRVTSFNSAHAKVNNICLSLQFRFYKDLNLEKENKQARRHRREQECFK